MFLFVLGALFLACSSNQSETINNEILAIAEKHIPDMRVEFFDVSYSENQGKIILNGATVAESAYEALNEFAESSGFGFRVDLLPVEPFRTNPWAVVNLSVCNIRAQARHSSELLTQALLGTPVKVFAEVDDWYLVQTPDRYFGWVDAAGITLKSGNELESWKALPKVLYAKPYGFAYADPGKSAVESDLVLADLLSVTDETDRMYKVLFPDGREAFVQKEACISLDSWNNREIHEEALLETAFQFKGVPYLWGGTSPKMFDCSGFTKTVYYFQGIVLQRDASQQTLYGELIEETSGYESLMPGDLVFFGRKASGNQSERVTHVGLCIGDQQFIHASGKIRINSLDSANESYTEHYEKAFVRARRILNGVDGEGIEWVVDNEFYKTILPGN